MGYVKSDNCKHCKRIMREKTCWELDNKLYCNRCWDKHISPEAIREKRLKKLLDKPWYEFW